MKFNLNESSPVQEQRKKKEMHQSTVKLILLSLQPQREQMLIYFDQNTIFRNTSLYQTKYLLLVERDKKSG
jgi:hypothetical protein